ncbi:uncharacterized protein LOC111269474 isoform X1 [Varroa jacobsoni]|uniref:Uncharacterized protein n=1 Tax=Varroa destructor TaxID=109461 RepID=A0A7M7JLU8_VARDE|nr:uncharacterized protein LOC111247400 isoform X1 [Varroa destructor]XP_022704829.1 uncharacterized protein LOC111269474 isoform X1 [Varroa jacobsoni]
MKPLVLRTHVVAIAIFLPLGTFADELLQPAVGSARTPAKEAECVANMTRLLEIFKEEFPRQVPDVIDIKGTGRKPGKSAMLLTGFQDAQLVTPQKLECSNETTVSFVVPIEGRAAVYLGPAVRPDVARTYFKATVKLAGTFNLLKGPSLEKIEVTKTALDTVQLLDSASSGVRDINQPAQQFVARVCSTLLKRALAKEVPAITKSGIAKSLADLQQTFINSSVAALEKRGVQIYKLLESMLKTNKESSTASKGSAKDKAEADRPITTQDLITRRRTATP